MSEPKPSSEQAEKLARQLQSALAQRRPWSWRPLLAVTVVVVGSGLVLAWFLTPRREYKPLGVLATDAVFAVGETPQARAQVLLPAAEEDTRRLHGQTILFEELRPTVKFGEKLHESARKTDEEGRATVADWPIPDPAQPADFLARYVNVALRHESVRDRGRIFVWPKDAAILLVAAEETLIAEKLDEQAAQTLHQATTDGWRIVYLVLKPEQPSDFQQGRGWLQQHARLPVGPVLGRRLYPSAESFAQAWRDALTSMRAHFSGPFTAVVKSAEAVQACKELNVRTVVLDEQGWATVTLAK